MVFFGNDTLTTQPAQKHRDLADRMIASHGEQLSRYIVNFTKTEAEKTRFAIATFGAVANYIDRAVTAFTLEQAQVKRDEEARRETARQAETDRLREEIELQGYQLFRDLPEIDRQTLLGRKRAELITNEKWKNADFSTDIFKIMFEKEAESLVRQDLLASE